MKAFRAMRPLATLGVTAGMLAAPFAAPAADWEWNPTLEAGYLFDDNYRLTQPGTEVEVQGPMVDAQLEMRARNPEGEFSFTPRIRTTYFPDAKELDATDYYGTLYWLNQGPKLRSEVNADVSDVDVVNSERPDAEVPGNATLGESDLGDSGRVLVQNRRTRGSIRPVFGYELSQRRSLEFGANYTDVSFDQQIPGAQMNYRNADLTAGLVTRLSPESSFTARLRGARYETDIQGNSDSYGAELQWDTRSAADTETFVRGGAQQVNFQDGSSATAWLAGAGVSMVRGRNELFADLSRSLGPSSAGIVIARDQLRLRWTRDITPRLSFLAGLRGTHDDDVSSDQSAYRARKYATGDIGLQWHWQEEFSMRVAYNYTWQDFDDALTDAATSSGAMLSVLYQPQQRRR